MFSTKTFSYTINTIIQYMEVYSWHRSKFKLLHLYIPTTSSWIITVLLTSSETHLYSPSALVSNPLEIISVPEVVNSPWGMGGVQVYPLGAVGAIVTEVSSKVSTFTNIPGTKERDESYHIAYNHY